MTMTAPSPAATAANAGCEGRKTTELWDAAAKLGYLGVNIPEEFGGGGGDLGDLAAVLEELAAGGCPLLMMVVSPAIVGTIINDFGTDDQKKRWLPGVADGSTRYAFGITEADAGSNSHKIVTTAFRTEDGVVQAVRGIDLHVGQGEVLAIVGESGSGKSVTMLSVLGLHPPKRTDVTGQIRWKGEDLLSVSDERMRQVRGGEIAMVFQDPLTALNPVHTVGKQITEMVRAHRGGTRRAARERAIEALESDRTLPVPAALLGPGDHYALEVSGDSMIEAGIFDGDYALVRRTESARDGEIVVALVRNEEATLKYLRRENGMIRLDPANGAYDPQIYRPDEVQVQGKLAGLLRRYH